VKAIILAAGEGSRMRPLTYSRPKVMLPIANKPILEHLLIEVNKAGITDFIFIVGYCDEQVRHYFGNGDRWGVNIDYCTQRRQLGTADALKMAKGLVDGNFVVLNGDIVVADKDIRRIMGAKGTTLGVIEARDTKGLGVVELSKGKVAHIYEKAEPPPSHIVNAGLYLFTPDIFDAIFSPVVNTVALQLLAYYAAKFRGCSIDFPRNLAKSVTVE